MSLCAAAGPCYHPAMIRLIVNADDLGIGPGRNRGIFEAFGSGIVSSASLLANGAAFAEAARGARALALPVGVHLNLSEGRPLCGPISGLTTVSGGFPGKSELRRRLTEGDVDAGGVRRELAAQVARVVGAGLVPSHLDSHQHCFLFPPVTGIVIELARACGIGALRLPAPAEPSTRDPSGPLGRELALYRRLSPTTRADLAASGCAHPEGLWGMPLLDRLDAGTLAELLPQIPAGTWELMVHPGEPDPGQAFSGEERRLELSALTDPAIRNLLCRCGIELITFRDL